MCCRLLCVVSSAERCTRICTEFALTCNRSVLQSLVVSITACSIVRVVRTFTFGFIHREVTKLSVHSHRQSDLRFAQLCQSTRVGNWGVQIPVYRMEAIHSYTPRGFFQSTESWESKIIPQSRSCDFIHVIFSWSSEKKTCQYFRLNCNNHWLINWKI